MYQIDEENTLAILRPMDTFWDSAAIFHKGDNFCDFLFAFLRINPLLKKGLLSKERICSHWEQILSL